MAAVVLGDIHLHFAWQAWHLGHWAGFGGALDFRCDAGRRDSFGVAALALGDIYLHFAWQAWQACHLWHWAGFGGARLVFGVRLGGATLLAWQAWHLATSIFTLLGRRGRRGTYGTGPALVARLVLGVTLGARDSFGSGRPGTWRHLSSLCVAPVVTW